MQYQLVVLTLNVLILIIVTLVLRNKPQQRRLFVAVILYAYILAAIFPYSIAWVSFKWVVFFYALAIGIVLVLSDLIWPVSKDMHSADPVGSEDQDFPNVKKSRNYGPKDTGLLLEEWAESLNNRERRNLETLATYGQPTEDPHKDVILLTVGEESGASKKPAYLPEQDSEDQENVAKGSRRKLTDSLLKVLEKEQPIKYGDRSPDPGDDDAIKEPGTRLYEIAQISRPANDIPAYDIAVIEEYRPDVPVAAISNDTPIVDAVPTLDYMPDDRLTEGLETGESGPQETDDSETGESDSDVKAKDAPGTSDNDKLTYGLETAETGTPTDDLETGESNAKVNHAPGTNDNDKVTEYQSITTPPQDQPEDSGTELAKGWDKAEDETTEDMELGARQKELLGELNPTGDGSPPSNEMLINAVPAVQEPDQSREVKTISPEETVDNLTGLDLDTIIEKAFQAKFNNDLRTAIQLFEIALRLNPPKDLANLISDDIIVMLLKLD